ncbi:MAG: MATE family efflux transporter [Bacillota bacterium]|nr:MATE family efflux transporter [Bacillota bacterium]
MQAEQVDAQALSAAQERRGLAAEVIQLSGPAIGEQLLWTAVQMTALIIVGRLGPEAIAAVGVANQLNWLFTSGFFALGSGTTTLVARFTGSGDRALASEATRQAVVLALLVAVVVVAVAFVFTPQVLWFMGTAPEVSPLASQYLRLSLVASLFLSINTCYAAALRGSGDTKTPFKVGLAGALFNIGVMWLLVYGRFGFPKMGVAGAGLGLIISYALVFCVYSVLFARDVLGIRLTMRGYRLDLGLIRRLLSVGLPAALEQLLMSGGMTIFARLVMSLGTIAYASHQVAANITSLSYMTGIGYAMAATTLVGRSLGEDRPDRAEAYGRMTQRIGVITMTILAAGFFTLGPYLVRFYTTEAEIIRSGAMVLKIAAFAQPAIASYSILAGALRGAGDTRYPLYITFAGIWTMRIGAAYLLVNSFGMGLAGVWVAVNLDQWVRAALVILRFRSGRWKMVKV